MKAGNLDRRITIEQPSTSRNGFGENEPTWSTLATVWAEVYPVKGSEEFAGQQVYAENTLGFRIRYRTDVTREMRVDYNGEKYDIRSVNQPRGTRHEVLEIAATARRL